MIYRADLNNNPTAFTTDIAQQAGLILGTEYIAGTAFPEPSSLFTAKLLGDPVAITIKVIDAIGYKTHLGINRWTYISMPKFIWSALTPDEKKDVIGYHYQYEGGITMRHLFPNYGAR